MEAPPEAQTAPPADNNVLTDSEKILMEKQIALRDLDIGIDTPHIVLLNNASNNGSYLLAMLTGIPSQNFEDNVVTDITVRRHREKKIALSITPGKNKSISFRHILTNDLDKNFPVYLTEVSELGG